MAERVRIQFEGPLGVGVAVQVHRDSQREGVSRPDREVFFCRALSVDDAWVELRPVRRTVNGHAAGLRKGKFRLPRDIFRAQERGLAVGEEVHG